MTTPIEAGAKALQALLRAPGIPTSEENTRAVFGSIDREGLAQAIVTAYGKYATECPCEQDYQVADAILAWLNGGK